MNFTSSWLTILIISFAVAATQAQTDNQRTIALRGSISPSAAIVVITNRGEQKCSRGIEFPPWLCSFVVSRDAVSVRLEIRSPGYKVMSLNVALPRSSNKRETEIDIGRIVLARAALPTIENIISGVTSNNARRFVLVLSNPLQKDVLVKKLAVAAVKPGNGASCCCPPNEIFKIKDQLVVSGGGKGTLMAKGDYVEQVKGSDLSVEFEAEISRFTCNDETKLTIRLPVSVTIPKESKSAIAIELPQRLRIVKSHYDDPKVRSEPVVNESSALTSQFAGFIFVLSTTDDVDLIPASYPLGTKVFDRMSWPFSAPFIMR